MEPSDFDGITIDELITTLQIYKTELGGEAFVTVQISDHSVIAPIDITRVNTGVVQDEPALILELRS
jgi:hypothetical protein